MKFICIVFLFLTKITFSSNDYYLHVGHIYPDNQLLQYFQNCHTDDAPQNTDEKIKETKNNKNDDKKSPKKTIKKRRPKKKWDKLNPELFSKMLQYEKEHPYVTQCELGRMFNINRSTYWRWKQQHCNYDGTLKK